MIGPLVLRSCARRVLPGFGHILAFALAPSCAALGDDLKPRGPNFHQRHCDSPTCAMSLLSWLAAFFMNSGIGKQNKKKKPQVNFPNLPSWSTMKVTAISGEARYKPGWFRETQVDRLTNLPNSQMLQQTLFFELLNVSGMLDVYWIYGI